MFVFLKSLIYKYHGIKMFKEKVPDLYFAKISNFLCILCSKLCLLYKTIQRNCKTWHLPYLNFTKH